MEQLENEAELAQSLKECCDKSGRETDLAKSAAIFHELGLVYRKRSPDKISLIQSVGLLNAAIARKPANVLQIQSDLSEVCQHILQLSKAKQQTVDLIKKAKYVKKIIDLMRGKVVAFLDSLQGQQISVNIKSEELHKREEHKISSIQNIGQFIADKYKQTMAHLSEYCQNVLGKPPCEYSVAGMGSLARKEITPYSDFEHVLLMEDHDICESNVEYFRWLTVIFHIIILNLQETIVPSLHITSLGPWYFDAYTPRGISFDGMMPHACKFPLGRQELTEKKPWTTELIRPVNEMLKYLSSEEDLKNGYHLKDILTKTCHVFGNENVYKQFANGVQLFLKKKTKQERMDDVKQQVKDDLNQFSTRFRLATLNSLDTINIKQMVYRSSTLFIAAFGTIHGISANSCFDIITEMANSNIITQKTKHKLLYAVAIACEMRLRVYMSNQSQLDNAVDLMQDRKANIEKFLNIVGVASIINYFQITYCLQCEIAKQLNFTKLHFYSNPQLLNLAMSLAFGLQNFNAGFHLKNSSGVWDISKFDFDTCLEEIETNFTTNTSMPVMNSTMEEQIHSIANRLQSNQMYDEALELYKYVVVACDNKPKARDIDLAIAEALYEIGACLWRMHQYNDALGCLKRSLDLFSESSIDESIDANVAKALNMKGNVMRRLHDYEDALVCYDKSLKIYHNRSSDSKSDQYVANLLNNIGLCLRDLHRYESSLSYLERSIKIRESLTSDKDSDVYIAKVSDSLGLCLQNLQQYDESLSCFNRSLKIYQNLTLDQEKDQFIARKLRNIGNCFLDMHQCDEALKHLNRSLKIYQNISLDEDKDRNVAQTLYDIAICFRDIEQKSDAANSFKRASKIYRKISVDTGLDLDITEKLSSIDRCLHELDNSVGS